MILFFHKLKNKITMKCDKCKNPKGENLKCDNCVYINGKICKIRKWLINKIKQKNLDFLKFVKTHEYYYFIKSDLFWDIWDPMIDEKDVFLSLDMISWMGFTDETVTDKVINYYKLKKNNILKFLDKNGLEFKQIKYDDCLVEKYYKIQHDIKIIKLLDIELLDNITWIIISNDEFKKAMKLLNEPQLLEHYTQIEKLLSDYLFNKNIYNLTPFEYKLNIPAQYLDNVDSYIKSFLEKNDIFKEYYIISKILKFQILEIKCFYDQIICNIKIFSKGFYIKNGFKVFGKIWSIGNNKSCKKYYLILNKEKMTMIINTKDKNLQNKQYTSATICEVLDSKEFYVEI